MRKTVAELLDEATRAPVTGWDFTWAAERTTVAPPPWDFGALAQDALRAAASALDMGTGGGEFLAGFPVLPARMVATESWAPNVTDAIAAEAGVTRGALYHQFADKIALFDAVLDTVEAEIAARLADEAAALYVAEAADRTQARAEMTEVLNKIIDGIAVQ